jgi:transposase
MSHLFWLDDESWRAIEPLIPMNRPGVKPGRNRQVISGILHVLKIGCRWCDCPQDYGPSTTIYNRFNRWSKAGIWQRMAEQLVVHDALEVQCIDSTTAKAHRCSAGGKGGPMSRRSAAAAVAEPPKSTPSSTMTAASSPST